MIAVAPSPIILDVECDRHRARLTTAACSLLGMYREDCQGCERVDHVADPSKLGKGNAWALKYAGYIQSRAKGQWKAGVRKKREVGE